MAGADGAAGAWSQLDLGALAEVPLNGRQIKNALRLGLALAQRAQAPLTQEQVMSTARIMVEFDEAVESEGKQPNERRLLSGRDQHHVL